MDFVGSHTLANVVAQTQYCGMVTACGLAQGRDLPGSVLPFILRNVTLAGIDSVNAPQEARIQGVVATGASSGPAQARAHDAGGRPRSGARGRRPDVRRESPGPHSRRRQRVTALRPFCSGAPEMTRASSMQFRGDLIMSHLNLHESTQPDSERSVTSVSPIASRSYWIPGAYASAVPKRNAF